MHCGSFDNRRGTPPAIDRSFNGARFVMPCTICYNGPMTTFDPAALTFIKLSSFEFPGGVAVYEYANHPAVDGNANLLRVNAYLSKDGDFVTIRRGLLEPSFAESKLGFVSLPEDFDLRESYTEELFRGYVGSAEAAKHIIAALRLQAVPPQVLSTGKDGALRCDLIS